MDELEAVSGPIDLAGSRIDLGLPTTKLPDFGADFEPVRPVKRPCANFCGTSRRIVVCLHIGLPDGAFCRAGSCAI